MTSADPRDPLDPARRLTCRRMRNRAGLFADLTLLYLVGQLEAGQAREFEVHLSECLICTEEVSRLRRMTALFTNGSADMPSSE
jgi:anti-sigma factor RsiW